MRLSTPGQWPVRASPVVSPIACRVFLPYLATQGGGTGTDFPVELIPATLNPGTQGRAGLPVPLPFGSTGKIFGSSQCRSHESSHLGAEKYKIYYENSK
jgi:hypothetical protein